MVGHRQEAPAPTCSVVRAGQIDFCAAALCSAGLVVTDLRAAECAADRAAPPLPRGGAERAERPGRTLPGGRCSSSSSSAGEMPLVVPGVEKARTCSRQNHQYSLSSRGILGRGIRLARRSPAGRTPVREQPGRALKPGSDRSAGHARTMTGPAGDWQWRNLLFSCGI